MPHKPVTVSRAWVLSMLGFAERQGVNTNAICRELATDPQLPERLPLDTVVRLWQRCAQASGDPFFGLHFGRQVRPGTFHVVGYTLMSCSTLGEALEKLTHYQRLVSEGGRITVHPGEAAFWLEYTPQPDHLPFIHHQIDAVMAAVLSFTQWMTARTLTPHQVLLAHDHDEDPEVYREFFGCDVLFGQNLNGMEVPRECLDWPLVDADPDLRKLHEGKARSDLARIDSPASLGVQIEQLLRATGRPLACSKQQIAEALNMSERTLQRRLEEENTQYRLLVESVASELACDWLSQGEVRLQAIAEELGFSDASAFHRAFLRWKGVSPGEWRRRQAGKAGKQR